MVVDGYGGDAGVWAKGGAPRRGLTPPASRPPPRSHGLLRHLRRPRRPQRRRVPAPAPAREPGEGACACVWAGRGGRTCTREPSFPPAGAACEGRPQRRGVPQGRLPAHGCVGRGERAGGTTTLPRAPSPDVECKSTGEQASGSTAIVCVVRRQVSGGIERGGRPCRPPHYLLRTGRAPSGTSTRPTSATRAPCCATRARPCASRGCGALRLFSPPLPRPLPAPLPPCRTTRRRTPPSSCASRPRGASCCASGSWACSLWRARSGTSCSSRCAEGRGEGGAP